MMSQIADALGSFAVTSASEDPALQWETQVDRLRERVEQWTGNSLQVVDLSLHEWRRPAKSHLALLSEIRRDGVELCRVRAMSLWSSVAVADG
ncbi:MAG TPA: hypothetical protein VNE21_08170 [Mycobacteriales bacterium]|nr:hypothetical protein [Mycobacteriales bacterium]